MANPIEINGAALLDQWHLARQELARAKLRLMQEQNEHALTKEKLVDAQAYQSYAKDHITDLEATTVLLEQKCRQHEQLRLELQTRLRQEIERGRGLEDQVNLREHHEVDIRGQIAIRDRLIQELREEIESIIRLKNRAIRIRDLVIEILRLSLEIEKENTEKAAVLSGGLVGAFFISPPFAIAAGTLTGFLGSLGGNLNNTRQNHLQNRIDELQTQLDQVKRAR